MTPAPATDPAPSPAPDAAPSDAAPSDAAPPSASTPRPDVDDLVADLLPVQPPTLTELAAATAPEVPVSPAVLEGPLLPVAAARPSDDPGAPGAAPDPALEDAPDAALARRAALGDRAAFDVIFRRHAEAMFRYAVHMLGGRTQDAEDAVQAALVKAWRHLPSFRGRSALRTWLFTITANEVRTLRRTARVVPVDDQLLADRPAPRRNEPAQQLQAAELWEVLAVALSELPWPQRASWILRELEGLGYDEIADVLGTDTTVVRGQLHRARRNVAVRMEQWR